jgi:hypothetical protein
MEKSVKKSELIDISMIEPKSQVDYYQVFEKRVKCFVKDYYL